MGRPQQVARAEKALQIYLALGPGRSLAKLVRHCADNEPGKPLSISTAKFWSKRFDWMDKAEKHDTDIAAQVRAQATKAQVVKRVDALDGIDKAIALCVRTIEEVATGVRQIEVLTPQDLRCIIVSLAEASKHKELLEGRATERAESRTPAELEAALAEVQRKLYGRTLSEFRIPTKH